MTITHPTGRLKNSWLHYGILFFFVVVAIVTLTAHLLMFSPQGTEMTNMKMSNVNTK